MRLWSEESVLSAMPGAGVMTGAEQYPPAVMNGILVQSWPPELLVDLEEQASSH